MFSAQIRVGRLIELSVNAPFEIDDLNRLTEQMRTVVQGSPVKVVACSDFRRATVLTQDVVEGLIDLMRNDNANVERSGLLVSTSAVFSMQMERIIRNAGNPNRRSFRAPAEAVAWLSEVLTLEERASLHRFVFS